MESSFLPLAETMSLQLPSLMTLLFNPLVILPSPLMLCLHSSVYQGKH